MNELEKILDQYIDVANFSEANAKESPLSEKFIKSYLQYLVRKNDYTNVVDIMQQGRLIKLFNSEHDFETEEVEEVKLKLNFKKPAEGQSQKVEEPPKQKIEVPEEIKKKAEKKETPKEDFGEMTKEEINFLRVLRMKKKTNKTIGLTELNRFMSKIIPEYKKPSKANDKILKFSNGEVVKLDAISLYEFKVKSIRC